MLIYLWLLSLSLSFLNLFLVLQCIRHANQAPLWRYLRCVWSAHPRRRQWGGDYWEHVQIILQPCVSFPVRYRYIFRLPSVISEREVQRHYRVFHVHKSCTFLWVCAGTVPCTQSAVQRGIGRVNVTFMSDCWCSHSLFIWTCVTSPMIIFCCVNTVINTQPYLESQWCFGAFKPPLPQINWIPSN